MSSAKGNDKVAEVQRHGPTEKKTIGYTVELGETMSSFLRWLASRSKMSPEKYARKIVVEALQSTLEQLTPKEARDLLEEADLAPDEKTLERLTKNDPMVTTVEAGHAARVTKASRKG